VDLSLPIAIILLHSFNFKFPFIFVAFHLIKQPFIILKHLIQLLTYFLFVMLPLIQHLIKLFKQQLLAQQLTFVN